MVRKGPDRTSRQSGACGRANVSLQGRLQLFRQRLRPKCRGGFLRRRDVADYFRRVDLSAGNAVQVGNSFLGYGQPSGSCCAMARATARMLRRIWLHPPAVAGETATLRLSRGLLAVDFPGDAKLVCEHAERPCPERLLKRHLHCSFSARALNMRSPSTGSSMPINMWKPCGFRYCSGGASEPAGMHSPIVDVACRILRSNSGGPCAAMGDSPHVSMVTILPPRQRS